MSFMDGKSHRVRFDLLFEVTAFMDIKLNLRKEPWEIADVSSKKRETRWGHQKVLIREFIYTKPVDPAGILEKFIGIEDKKVSCSRNLNSID